MVKFGISQIQVVVRKDFTYIETPYKQGDVIMISVNDLDELSNQGFVEVAFAITILK